MIESREQTIPSMELGMILCDLPPVQCETWQLTPPEPMRVLILTASFGEGHNSAARGLKAALDERAHLSLSCQTHLLDVCSQAYPKLRRLARIAYLKAIHHSPRLWRRVFEHFDAGKFLERRLPMLKSLRQQMEHEIGSFQPNVVVSTFPFYNQVIDLIYPSSPPPFSRFTVVTDSIRINAVWARGNCDFYIVPNRLTFEALKQHGVPVTKILDLGFPVSLKFANCQIHRPMPPPWRVLYMPGGPWQKIEANVRVLARLPNMELTVSWGRDPKLMQNLQRLCSSLPRSVRLLGWIDDMPEKLLSQHIVIGKAGGAVVQECIAAGCPMIISQVIPGQEEGNIALLLQQGVGAVADDAEQLEKVMIRACQGEGALWQTWKTNLLSIQRPLAAQTLARFILGKVEAHR